MRRTGVANDSRFSAFWFPQSFTPKWNTDRYRQAIEKGESFLSLMEPAPTFGSGWLAPSRPREFHPEPLTDPDLNLSIHPARAIDEELPPFVKTAGSSCHQLTL